MVHVEPTERIISAYGAKENKAWMEHRRFRQPIREYRNLVVHDVQLGTIRAGDQNLMPNPTRSARTPVSPRSNTHSTTTCDYKKTSSSEKNRCNATSSRATNDSTTF